MGQKKVADHAARRYARIMAHDFPEDDDVPEPPRKIAPPPVRRRPASPEPFAFGHEPPNEIDDLSPRITPIQHVQNPYRPPSRSIARTALWAIYLALAAFVFLLQSAAIAAGGNAPRIGFDETYRLLAGFFFFYAIDRIIG